MKTKLQAIFWIAFTTLKNASTGQKFLVLTALLPLPNFFFFLKEKMHTAKRSSNTPFPSLQALQKMWRVVHKEPKPQYLVLMYIKYFTLHWIFQGTPLESLVGMSILSMALLFQTQYCKLAFMTDFIWFLSDCYWFLGLHCALGRL